MVPIFGLKKVLGKLLDVEISLFHHLNVDLRVVCDPC